MLWVLIPFSDLVPKHTLRKMTILRKRLLGMIVCRRHAWDAEKGEEVFLLRADEIRSQGFGRLEAKGLFTDALEFSEELFLDPLAELLGDVAGFEFLADVACPGAEILEAVGEGIYVFVFLSLWQERMFPMDLFDRGDDMGQTGLPVCADPVIGRIAIAHQGAGKVLSEDGLGHLGGAVSVDVKEGEVFIAPKPHVVADPIVSP